MLILYFETVTRRLVENYWILWNSNDFFTWRAFKCRLTALEKQRPLVEYRLRGLPKPLLVRPHDYQDHGVIWEIFYQREYEITWKFKKHFRISKVLDCGANIGYFAAYIPIMTGSQVETYIGVEPHPGNFALLKEQAARQQPGRNIALHNVAISDRDGVTRFHWDHDNRAHRISADYGTTEVQTLTIPTILDQHGVDVVDLLKLDIEGGERQVLSCLDSWSNRVRVILVELHPFIDETLTFDWFASLARSHGFHPFCNRMLERHLPDRREPTGGLICVAIRDDVPLPAELIAT
jgi:FkbM family methyltransferase